MNKSRSGFIDPFTLALGAWLGIHAIYLGIQGAKMSERVERSTRQKIEMKHKAPYGWTSKRGKYE